MIPTTYRALLANPPIRRLLSGMAVSSLGDGMSAVTVAWLAVRLAPRGSLGVFVGGSIAAYTLPGALGALLLARLLRRRPARALVLANCLTRAGLLGAIALLALLGGLEPLAYVALLAGSSALSTWGTAGEYTLLSALGGAEGRLAANSLATAQESAAVIVGPAIAGLALVRIDPGWLLLFDAASFAFMGAQTLRVPATATPTAGSLGAGVGESGFRLLRRNGLVGLIVVSWVFFFLYGPVEDALPVYVAADLHAHAWLLGVYWSAYGVGALVASLLTAALRGRPERTVIVTIVAGWGACLLPFAFAPVGVTIGCFVLGGVIYGPFIPFTYSIFQSAAAAEDLPSLLAARGAFTTVAAPLGTAAGGPLVAALGASGTLAGSGAATLLLAAGAWVGSRARSPDVVPGSDAPAPGRPEEPR